MKEEWKDIEGYEGRYAISSKGRLYSYRYRRIIVPGETKKGYFVQGLCKDGKMKSYLIHRLVAQAFIPNPDNFDEVNHKDLNKKNNSIENLEWVTRKDNRNHAIRNGHLGYRFGKGNGIGKKSRGNRRLTKEQVFEIRNRLRNGETGVSLAKEYGVGTSCISHIRNDKTWKNGGNHNGF